MSPLPFLPLIGDAVRTLLDRLLPDPQARAAAELELRRLEREPTYAQAAAQAIALAQIETNKGESAQGTFRGGWRPYIGWTCGAALSLQFVVGPVAQWVAAAAGHPLPPMPSLDGVLWELLFGLLGLGALRTVEKVKGKA